MHKIVCWQWSKTQRLIPAPKPPPPKSPVPKQASVVTPNRPPPLPSSQPVLRPTHSSSFSQADAYGLQQQSMGPGQANMPRDHGFDVAGRETRGDFRSLPFDEQIATVGQDLKDHFWHDEAQVICNSFGAYFFLHAQTQMPSFPGRVLLLSPIVGEFTNAQARTSFSPPRPTRLKDLAEAGHFKVPR